MDMNTRIKRANMGTWVTHTDHLSILGEKRLTSSEIQSAANDIALCYIINTDSLLNTA